MERSPSPAALEPMANHWLDLDMMGNLKLYGMRSAYDEVMAAGIKRQHEPPRIVGDLLQSEIAEKQARSIRYQMTVAKLPLAKDIEEFDFTGTPINEGLVRELANGNFVTDQRNVVLIGGTGTGKTHLAIAIARALIRSGTRGRFYNVVDLVNRLEIETRGGKQQEGAEDGGAAREVEPRPERADAPALDRVEREEHERHEQRARQEQIGGGATGAVRHRRDGHTDEYRHGEEQRAVSRVLLASTFELELDGSGRVLVPETLRSQLGDERELVVIGNNDHAEIWGKQAWEQYQARNEGLLDRIDRILGGQGGAT